MLACDLSLDASAALLAQELPDACVVLTLDGEVAHWSRGAQTTFGYVVGFIAAAAVVGFLASRGGDRTPLRTVLTMSAGTLVIYAVGVPWLAQDLGIGLTKAAELGMTDFLVGDGIKVLAAAGLLPAAWALVKRTLR